MSLLSRLLCLTALIAGFVCLQPTQTAQAQHGQGLIAPIRSVNAPISSPLVGHAWAGIVGAEESFGFDNSYATGGFTLPLGSDYFDAWYMLDARGHLSTEGNFFGNLGIARRLYLKPARATIGMGVWYDYDGDQYEEFGHDFHQIGVSGEIQGEFFDVRINGYIPIGTTEHIFGEECFIDNRIVTVSGVDAALEGFDAEVSIPIYGMEHYRGVFDVGGYMYKANFDGVRDFGGFRCRVSCMPVQGFMLAAELNQDEVFDTTGLISLTTHMGTSQGYAPNRRDLEPFVRRAHITRFHRDPEFAIDPDTGDFYHVVHVDNTAAPGGDGTFENPFNTLEDADGVDNPGNSFADSIILVREGDGTTTGYDTNIALLDGQLLFGDGVEHIIPLLGGGTFTLCNDIDGERASITNSAAGPVVTLADRNEVAGFIFDQPANDAIAGVGVAGGLTVRDNIFNDVGLSAVAVFGGSGDFTIIDNVVNGTGDHAFQINAIAGPSAFTVSSNVINDATGNGVQIDGVVGTGTFAFDSNVISNATGNGVFIDNVTGPASTYAFTTNTITGADVDGIHIEDSDGTTFAFVDNTSVGVLGDGLSVERVATAGVDIDITGQTSTLSGDNGIRLASLDGDVLIDDATIDGSTSNGILLSNVLTTAATDMAAITDSTISGNGVGAGAGVNINTSVPGTTDVLITGNSIDANGIGVRTVASGVGTTVNTTVVDNTSISFNNSNALNAQALDGATQNVVLQNTLLADGNGAGIGAAVRLLADSAGGTSSLVALIDSNNFTNSNAGGGVAGGVNLSANGNAFVDVEVSNNAFDMGTGDAVNIGLAITNNITSSVVFSNNTINDFTGDGFDIDVSNTTRSSISLIGNTITDVGLAGIFGGQEGIEFDAVDATRTALLISNNDITNTPGSGIDINLENTSIVLADILGNSVTTAGDLGDLAAAPFAPGVDVLTEDSSQLALNFDNNSVTDAADQGLALTAFDNSVLAAFVTNNTLFLNDQGNDPVGDPVGPPIIPPNLGFLEDFEANGFSTVDLCVALSNNQTTFGFDFNGFNLDIDVDGSTNSPDPSAFDNTGGAFGTTCNAAIATIQANFLVP